MKSLFARIVPFIFFGIAAVAVFFGLMLLAYLFVLGAIVGLVLFIFAWVKARFFPSRAISPPKRTGRTYDHEE